MTKPRIRDLDKEFVEQRLVSFLQSKDKTQHLLTTEPGKLEQTRYACLAGECATIGFYRYGLGFPLEDVADAFREAALASLRVFQLRGTEAPFPVTTLTIDPEKRPGDPAYVIGDKQLHPAGSKDFSTTNSKAGLDAMFFAIIAQDQGLACGLADLIGDPPNASYIGPTSEVCTPNEQHFAYSVKQVLKNNYEKASSEISKLSRAKKEGWVDGVRTMTKGIVAGEASNFLDGLHAELSRHRKEARKESNSWRPEFYLSLYGLGMALLAMRKGVVSRDDLPQSDVYLPLDFMVK